MQIAQKNFYKKFLGRAGELKAVEFLKNKRYKILKTNYKTYAGEIDIIAESEGVTVFVEVKTRLNDDFGQPAEAVDARKRAKYYKVATEFLVKENRTESLCRFDVIEIENGEINHIENAFGF